jgi:hypothetical protein
MLALARAAQLKTDLIGSLPPIDAHDPAARLPGGTALSLPASGTDGVARKIWMVQIQRYLWGYTQRLHQKLLACRKALILPGLSRSRFNMAERESVNSH